MTAGQDAPDEWVEAAATEYIRCDYHRTHRDEACDKPSTFALDRMRDALAAVLPLVADERDELLAENERMRAQIGGECIGCNYQDGRDECCPMHGRTLVDWMGIADAVIGRENDLRAEMEAERDRAVRDALTAAVARLEALLPSMAEAMIPSHLIRAVVADLRDGAR